MSILTTAAGFALNHWDWLAGGASIATGGLAWAIPKAWKWIVLGALALAVGIFAAVMFVRVANLRADLNEARAEAYIAQAERDQEKATADHNAEIARKMAASAARAQADRRALLAELASARARTETILREIARDPNRADPLPDPLRPFLRRVR